MRIETIAEEVYFFLIRCNSFPVGDRTSVVLPVVFVLISNFPLGLRTSVLFHVVLLLQSSFPDGLRVSVVTVPDPATA